MKQNQGAHIRKNDGLSLVKRMCQVVMIVVLLGASGPSIAQDMLSTATTLINIIQTASSFFAPEPGPDQTLEAVLQNREGIRKLHERMGNLENGLLLAVKGLDQVHEKLKDELRRSSDRDQRDRVRGAMESVQSYVAGMQQEPDRQLIVTQDDRNNLSQRLILLSQESATLAQKHDINAPVLVGALAIELGLLQALNRHGHIETTKEYYRKRLVSLFDPERSRRNSARGPSLREELVRIVAPRMRRITEEIEYNLWNQSSNYSANLNRLQWMYNDGQISCQNAHSQAKQSIIRMTATICRAYRHSAQRPSFNFSQQASDATREIPRNLCLMHHELLAYTKAVVERLGPTEEERQWMRPSWPCSPEGREEEETNCQQQADLLKAEMENAYEDWSRRIYEPGCTS